MPTEDLREAMAAIIEDNVDKPGYADRAADAILSLLRERDQWRPIETAPRDGTTVLLFAPAWDSPRTGWTYEEDPWQDCPFHFTGNVAWIPTCWRPLPPPPAPQGEET